jgi:hypothetical protein
MRNLLTDFAKRREDIFEFHRLARGGTGFRGSGPHASRVRSPCCKDSAFFAERQIRIIHDLIGMRESTGWVQQQRAQIDIGVPGSRLPAARIWHARLSSHLSTPTTAQLPHCATRDAQIPCEHQIVVSHSHLNNMDTRQIAKSSLIGGTAAKHLRNNQKKFKDAIASPAVILNALFALQY